MSETKLAQIVCPVCDSTDVEQRTEKRKIGDVLTGFETIDEHICTCANCGQEGDFVGRNDEIYKAAMADLTKRAVIRMLENLGQIGCTNAHLERVMQLPQRTLSRWKKEGASAAAVAMVKCIVTYPWMLEVAEHQYEPAYSKAVLIREAGNIFVAALSVNNWSMNVAKRVEGGEFTITLSKDKGMSTKVGIRGNLALNEEEIALAA